MTKPKNNNKKQNLTDVKPIIDSFSTSLKGKSIQHTKPVQYSTIHAQVNDVDMNSFFPTYSYHCAVHVVVQRTTTENPYFSASTRLHALRTNPNALCIMRKTVMEQ